MINLDLLEPITYENISELQAGEWIWDNKPIERQEHRRTLDNKQITEPMGFRLIHVLDLDYFGRFSNKPFMLSHIDGYRPGYFWECFELGRFYKFKKIEIIGNIYDNPELW